MIYKSVNSFPFLTLKIDLVYDNKFSNDICNQYWINLSFLTGELAQMVERLLRMREVLGAIPEFSKIASQ